MPIHQFRSITELLVDLERRGFTSNFEYLDNAFTAVDLGRTFTADELAIVEHHRFEGASNPDDMAVVYAIESRDGIRGVVVDAFGVYANPELGEFLRKVKFREST